MIWFWFTLLYALLGIGFLFLAVPEALGELLGGLFVLVLWPIFAGGALAQRIWSKR